MMAVERHASVDVFDARRALRPGDAMMAVERHASVDVFDARRALRATGLLRTFGDAGILAAADVHVATRLAWLIAERTAGAGARGMGAATDRATVTGGDGESPAEADAVAEDDVVALAVALAVRAPRLGHVCTDLATVHETVTAEGDVPVDLQALPWPDPATWIDDVARSPLVAVGDEGDGDGGGRGDQPLRLLGSRLYLDRYWREERAIAEDLRARAGLAADDVDEAVLQDGLARLFPGAADPAGPDAAEPDRQRQAAESAVRRRFAVVAGGPGTGKTTTVASILALLTEQAAAAGRPPPRVALAAPTGKAAARLEEAVHETAEDLHIRGAIDDGVRDRLLAGEASTLHRLLGWRPGNRSRFRHDRANRLPHEVIIVDETSMVSLSLMSRLVAAVRDGARLILVGDPDQLASVEAGAVLGDVVGPAREVEATDSPIARAIVVLRRVHRYGPELGRLAEAVQRGDDDTAMSVLRGGDGPISLVEVDLAATSPSASALDPVRDAVVAAARTVVAAAEADDGAAAIAGLAAVRVLCAHRRGPYGAQTWRGHIEAWLAAAIEGYGAGGRWYAGRPLLITENDYGLGLYNGDTGVVLATGEGRAVAAFERRGEIVRVAPSRLSGLDTVHAMTVHKSQGSQFGEVAVLLPDRASPILTRELLYTAVTRARDRVTVVGTETAIRAAVRRPIARASGLREALWGAVAP